MYLDFGGAALIFVAPFTDFSNELAISTQGSRKCPGLRQPLIEEVPKLYFARQNSLDLETIFQRSRPASSMRRLSIKRCGRIQCLLAGLLVFVVVRQLWETGAPRWHS